MQIVWLASYPKSGNTWLRFFLYNYYYGKVSCSDQVAKAIPDIHKSPRLDDGFPGRVFCKTHFTLSPRHPYLAETSAFVYLIRNPRDILLSSLNFRRMQGKVSTSDQQFARDFIKDLGVLQWREFGMGNWIEHVNSWLETPSFPYLLLRYEDLVASPEVQFERLLDFLGDPVDKERLTHAVKNAALGKLRSIEEKEKAENHYSDVFSGSRVAHENGLRFINEGRSRHSLAHLGEDIDQLFDEHFGALVHDLGY
jgi:hypothetical protein